MEFFSFPGMAPISSLILVISIVIITIIIIVIIIIIIKGSFRTYKGSL